MQMPGLGKNRGNGKHARLCRREKVNAMYLRGCSQMAIAQVIGCTQQTVSSDLTWLREQWQSTMLTDFNDRQLQEIQKVDELERVYWESFEKSREPKEKTSAERTTNAVGGETNRTGLRREMREGSSCWLEGVERCITLRC